MQIIHKKHKVNLTFRFYPSGNVAITGDSAEDGIPYATFTKHFPGLSSKEVVLDINNLGESLPAIFIEADIIQPERIRTIPSGFVVYPVYALTDVMYEEIFIDKIR